MKNVLFLFILYTKIRYILAKDLNYHFGIKLSTSTNKYSTSSNVHSCYIYPNLLAALKIFVIPMKSKYNNFDQIVVRCQPGYYLQKPRENQNSTFFKNECVNGTWKISLSFFPICKNSCQQWNVKLKRFQSVYINISDEDNGIILSPGYPDTIPEDSTNCSYVIETKNLLKLSVLNLSLTNFYLEIVYENEKIIWPNNISTAEKYHLIRPKGLIINLKKVLHPQIHNGKIEHFKLSYRTINEYCKTYVNDPNLIIYKTKWQNFTTIETYSCRYPYTLVGSDRRLCLNDVWTTLSMPKCKFICNAVNEIKVDSTLKIKIILDNTVNCKMQISAKNRNKILKITIEKLSFDTNNYCLNLEKGYEDRICLINKTNHLYFSQSISFTIFQRLNENTPETLDFTIESIHTKICPLPPIIKNGIIQYENHSLFSVAKVLCKNNFFSFGSQRMKCLLHYSGNAQWYSDIEPRCIKLCNDQWKEINYFSSRLSVQIPLFLNLNFTENQNCKWKIKSHKFFPLISISSIVNINDFVNFSMSVGIGESKENHILMDRFIIYKNITKIIFLCPQKICYLTMVPIFSFQSLKEKIYMEIVINLLDTPSFIEHHLGIFFLMFFGAILILFVFLVYFDYSHHPFTGYTARVIKIINSSRMNANSAFSMFDITFSNPKKSSFHSDFVVFYNRHHSQHPHVHVQRSVSCAEMNKNSPKYLPKRIEITKRRFSDLTDMIFTHCSTRRKNIETLNKNNVKTEATNQSYECDKE